MQILMPTQLGEAIHESPLSYAVPEGLCVPALTQWPGAQPPQDLVLFEKAGPRRKLYFDPARTRAAIVTCGGLCPGLNNVIRSVTRELRRSYGVPSVLGIRDGYRGLDPSRGQRADRADRGTGRGHPQRGRHDARHLARAGGHPKIAVDFLMAQRINLLFTVGGDGTQRGGHALFEEARAPRPCAGRGRHPQDHRQRRALSCRAPSASAPRCSEAVRVIDSAHTEARSVEQRRVAGQADGPPRRLHRRRRHGGQPGRQLLPGARGALRAGGRRRPPRRAGAAPAAQGATP